MKKIIIIVLIVLSNSCSKHYTEIKKTDSIFIQIDKGYLTSENHRYRIYQDKTTGVKYIEIESIPHGYSFSRYYEKDKL